MVVTKHAAKRLKERLGLSKKTVEKVAMKAFQLGTDHSAFKSSAKRYLDGLYLSHKKANNLKVYANYVYLFHGEVLITVLDLPKKYQGGKYELKEKAL